MSISERVSSLFSGDEGDESVLPAIPLTIAEALQALRTERRRFAISYIYSHGQTTTGELADERAMVEFGSAKSSPRKCTYISYYQTHLPRLDDLGVIEFDQARGVVTPTALTDALAEWVQAIDEAAMEAESR